MPLQIGSLIAALLEPRRSKEEECLWDDKEQARCLGDSVKFHVPNITPVIDDGVIDYANTLVISGILRLPYPICYFEFSDINCKFKNVNCISILATHDSNDQVFTRSFARHINDSVAWRFGEFISGWTCSPDNPRGWLNAWPLYASLKDRDLTLEEIDRSGMAEETALYVAATVAFMDLKEANISDVRTADSVAKKRQKLGLNPIYSHKVLSLNPKIKREYFSGTSSLISRRAHWRRGHLRHLSSGKIVPVAPAFIRGDGFVAKEYRISS